MASDKTPVVLREVNESDLPIFFVHLRDPQAASMAAITDDDPNDRNSFETRWAKLLRNEDVAARTIAREEDGEVLGHIIGFPSTAEFRVSYWVDRDQWGKGVATSALRQFLAEVQRRPIYARAPKHNEPAVKVLKNNGFHLVGEESGYVPERGRVVDELILRHN